MMKRCRAFGRLQLLSSTGGFRQKRNVHRIREEAFGPSRLDLQEIDRGLFLAQKEQLLVPIGGLGVFGGQVAGQALHAAARTLPEGGGHQVHSMHSYFLKPGIPTRPILYDVKETSNGRTFATRSVQARQNGVIIYKMQASFQEPEESHFEHTKQMPDAPMPESLPSADERVQQLLNDKRTQGDDERSRTVRAIVVAFLRMKYPIEIKYASYQPDYLDEDPEPMEARRLIWMKTRLPLGDDPNMHCVAAAFYSDHALLATALLPHGIQFPGVSMEKLKILASLDHSMWFHSSFRADDWMLYEMESPRATGGRALSFGHIYTRDGELAVSVAQEGVLRKPRGEKKREGLPIVPPILEAK